MIETGWQCCTCQQSLTVLPKGYTWNILFVHQVFSICSPDRSLPFFFLLLLLLLGAPLCLKASALPLEELLALYGYGVPGQILQQPARDRCQLATSLPTPITLEKVRERLPQAAASCSSAGRAEACATLHWGRGAPGCSVPQHAPAWSPLSKGVFLAHL